MTGQPAFKPLGGRSRLKAVASGDAKRLLKVLLKQQRVTKNCGLIAAEPTGVNQRLESLHRGRVDDVRRGPRRQKDLVLQDELDINEPSRG